MTPAERAAAFLVAADDELLASWAPVLLGTGSAELAAERVVERQRPDGSFGDLSETRRVLALLDDVGSRGGPVLERAGAWLGSVQSADGCWGAGEDRAVFETGVLTGILARSPGTPVALLDAAADWLAARFTPDTVKGHWRPLAAFAAAFANLPHDEGDGILQWCGRELERGFRGGRFDPVQVVRLLLWCDTPSLPGGRVSAFEVLPLLVAAQAPDGAFRPGAARAETLQASWDGLVALLRFRGPDAAGLT